MKKYQYQIVRYIHDRVTLEFVNVGIIVFQPETQFLKCKFISKFGRISQFFNEVNGHFLISTLKNFEHQINDTSKTISELFFDYKDLSEITNAILPKDDSAIECSEIFLAIDINPQVALNDLFERLVNKYISEIEKDTLDDKHVWRNVYKEYFDKYNVTKTLKSHSVQTSHDTLEFDKSWKNGAWNCYQSLNFNLKRLDTIKNKVYKWSGIINELRNANEDVHLFLLTTSPQQHKHIKIFIEDTLQQKQSKNVEVHIIYENQAEKFAKSVSEAIEKHQN